MSNGRLVLLTVGAVLVASASAWAQPAARAIFRAIEGGSWEASPASPFEGGRICLESGSYVVAVRVEPGYEAWFSLAREGGEVEMSHLFGSHDGRRWQWGAFRGGQCYDVITALANSGTDRQVVVRIRLYEMLFTVDW